MTRFLSVIIVCAWAIPAPIYANVYSCNFLQKLFSLCPVENGETQSTSVNSSMVTPPSISVTKKSSTGKIRVIRKKQDPVYELKIIEGGNAQDDLFSQLTNIEHDTVSFNPVATPKIQPKHTSKKRYIRVIRSDTKPPQYPPKQHTQVEEVFVESAIQDAFAEPVKKKKLIKIVR